MKKVLMVASVPSMIGQFNMDNIRMLLNMGYQVDVAANFKDYSSWPEDKTRTFQKDLYHLGIHFHQTDFARTPANIKCNLRAFYQILRLIRKNHYYFIHTHTPVASFIVRLAAHKTGTKVIYTAHGFHFYKGAPFKNWLFFYPVEKLMSRYTDVLVTINREDYKLAKEKFHAKRVVYIPGVGIDTDKFKYAGINRNEKRKELGLSEDDIVLLSVGELNANKNHELAIKALAKLRDKHFAEFAQVQYLICGQGNLKEYLEKVIFESRLENQIHLLGYREDINEILGCSDIFLFLSKREGLPIALIEAMASGLACVVTHIRGNVDLIRDHKEGLIVDTDVQNVSHALLTLIHADRKKYQKNAIKRSKEYSNHVVNRSMEKIYLSL